MDVGYLAVCVSVRDLPTGAVESHMCDSVLQAVTLAISVLHEREDKTAVVVVGENGSAPSVEAMLAERAGGLCISLDQAGLFLTLAAQDIVRDRLLSDARFEDFGIHSIDETGRAERLFAVIHPDLYEPVLPHRNISGNCPRLHKSFVGRHRETDELQDLILQRTLITISGPPGVGKSTTAIHVGRSFDDEYEDGVWWFSVDDRTSLDELLQAIANARGLLSLQGPLSIDRVAEGLRTKRGIIILDGCESMAAEIGAFCSAVLAQNNSLTLLLTSTKPIGIENEYIYRLQPMSLPRPTDSGEDALINGEALSLFFERATQSGIRLALDDKNIELVGSICEHVDGLPAAIELVAASLRTSSLPRLQKELEKTLGSVVKRWHGFEHALELSYRSISVEEHALLHRLSIFRSEWKTDVALRLWEDQFDEETMQRLHLALADTSWLAYDPDRDTYRMLHTVRSFCWEQAGDAKAGLLKRFSGRICELAASIWKDLQRDGALDAEALLSRHYSDVAFALDTALGAPDQKVEADQLMRTIVHLWLRRNLLEDAEQLSEAYLNSGVTGMEAARALVMVGVVHLRRRKLALAASTFERCLILTREAENKAAEAATLTNLGLTEMDRGEYDKARACYQEALSILREGGQANQLCGALCNAADVEVKYACEAGVPAVVRQARLNSAAQLLQEASGLVEESTPVVAQSLYHVCGAVALAAGDATESESNLLRAIAICARHGLRHEAAEATEALAEINLAKGLGPTAAKLLGLSRQIRKESGKTSTDIETERYGRLITKLHQQVDSDRADKLMRYGEKLDLAEILTPTIFNV